MLAVLFAALLSGNLYWYAALPYNVVDGDTIDAVIDVGFHERRDERLRLVWYDDANAKVVGVDTPELNSRDLTVRERARTARSYTETWLAYHGTMNTETLKWGGQEVSYFVVRTEKDDAFGRWLADVRCQLNYSLGKDLLDSGNAVVWLP
jgi:hypothetical protein